MAVVMSDAMLPLAILDSPVLAAWVEGCNLGGTGHRARGGTGREGRERYTRWSNFTSHMVSTGPTQARMRKGREVEHQLEES